MDAGVVGGVVGGAIGVLGGILGTFFSIRSATGPREWAFLVQVAAVGWLVMAVLVIGLFMLPRPVNFLLGVPYGIALPLGIVWCKRRQSAIRLEEAEAAPAGR